MGKYWAACRQIGVVINKMSYRFLVITSVL